MINDVRFGSHKILYFFFALILISITVGVLSISTPLQKNAIVLLIFILLNILLYFRASIVYYGLIALYPLFGVLTSPIYQQYFKYGNIVELGLDALTLYVTLIICAKSIFVNSNKNLRSNVMTRVFRIGLVVLIFFSMTLLWGGVSTFGEQYLRRMLVPLCMLVLSIYFIQDKKAEAKIYNVISFNIFVELLVCAYQFKQGQPMYGTFYHYANLAMYINFYLLFSIWKFAFDKGNSKKKRRLLPLVGAALVLGSFVPFVFVQERTEWLAFVLGSIPLIFRSWKLISMYLIGGSISFAILHNTIIDRFSMIFSAGNQGSYDTANSAGWRLNVWTQMIQAIKRNPIIGYGIGTSNKYVGNIYAGVDLLPHNEFLRIAYEGGSIGLILFMLYLLFPFWAMKQLRINSDSKKYSLLYISVTLAYLMCMFSDNIVTFPDISSQYFIIVGIYLAHMINTYNRKIAAKKRLEFHSENN